MRESDLTKNELLVYMALLNRADANGDAWPSVPLIAKESRTSPRTVQTTIKLLQRRGLVTKRLRPRGDGTNQSNMYRVAIFKRKQAEGGRNHSTMGVQGLQPPGAGVAGEEDPVEVNPVEEDMRSALTIGRDFSFVLADASSATATAKQLGYISDLHLHYNNRMPSAALRARWAALSGQQATTLIEQYLREVPRYDSYEGPEAGEPTYDALSATGQQWADAYLIPEAVSA